jgi:hypothetical protein
MLAPGLLMFVYALFTGDFVPQVILTAPLVILASLTLFASAALDNLLMLAFPMAALVAIGLFIMVYLRPLSPWIKVGASAATAIMYVTIFAALCVAFGVSA